MNEHSPLLTLALIAIVAFLFFQIRRDAVPPVSVQTDVEPPTISSSEEAESRTEEPETRQMPPAKGKPLAEGTAVYRRV